MVLSAQTIRRLGIVTPFSERTIDVSGKSYGLSACGYDLRLRSMLSESGKVEEDFLLQPGMFALGVVIEHMKLPADVVGKVHDKSTWARRGVCVQNTVVEPGWEGYLTIEVTNHGKEWIRLTGGMPICQIVFHRLDEPTEMPYDGKYQNQPPVPTPAIFQK